MSRPSPTSAAPRAPARHLDASYRGALRPCALAMGVLCLAAGAGLVLDAPRLVERLPPPEPASALAPQAPPRSVHLDIVSTPGGAAIFLDGVYVGRTPARAIPARIDGTGRIALELRRGGYADLRRELVLAPDVDHARVELAFTPTD